MKGTGNREQGTGEAGEAGENYFYFPSHQSPVTSHQSPVTSHQSPITSHQSPIKQ
ncbi:hypothetical protein PN497_24875 [Sphaerospermopsis kisseleviana CS-549]|uniref:Uncharacterized protein n=1 Tax=Sphaerospermopsis kisseleviana CS-549 TaxID=3021783 RepID=A0ABT4ZZ71_9CYAN|nr:hypothetical protein [Sphaerospermopsis kisseleviana]MDB9444559.1 hypothetical protein [Sphaerospermopsis kisseleviana CS-549]